jgi:hypothetical protein
MSRPRLIDGSGQLHRPAVFIMRRVQDGIRLRGFGVAAALALARRDLPLDRGLRPAGAGSLALLSHFKALDAFSLALLRGSLTLVGKALALVSKVLAVAGDPVALIRDPVALIGSPLAPVEATLPLLRRSLTSIVQSGALRLQRDIPA